VSHRAAPFLLASMGPPQAFLVPPSSQCLGASCQPREVSGELFGRDMAPSRGVWQGVSPWPRPGSLLVVTCVISLFWTASPRLPDGVVSTASKASRRQRQSTVQIMARGSGGSCNSALDPQCMRPSVESFWPGESLLHLGETVAVRPHGLRGGGPTREEIEEQIKAERLV